MVPVVAVMMCMNLVLINQYMHSERTWKDSYFACPLFVTR